MKRLLLTCSVMALFSGANAIAAPAPTPGGGLTGALEHQYSFTFGGTNNNGNGGATLTDPKAVEVAHHTGLFAIATEDKDVVTDELVTINTNVVLNNTVDDTTANDFAEASAMGVQTNTDNKDCSNCAEKTDTIGGPTAGDGAVNNDVGLMSVNQAAGNMNNQGTLVSASVDAGEGGFTGGTPTTPPTPVTPTGTSTNPGGGFAHAQAEATQYNGSFIGGEVGGQTGESAGNTVEAVDLITRSALIQNSFNSDGGLVYVNQSTGNNNNQLNELSLAFSARPQGVAIAESDLGQWNTGNTVGESSSETPNNRGIPVGSGTGINKSAEIDSSFNGDVGVFGANQAVGNNGNQANIVSVAAVGTNLPGF